MNARADVLTQTLRVADEPSLCEGRMHSGRLVTASRRSSCTDLPSPASPPDLPPSPGQPPNALSQNNDTGNEEQTDTESNQPLLSSSASATSLPTTRVPTPALPSPTLPPTNAPDDVWNHSVPVLGSQNTKRIYYRAPFQWGQWTQEQWKTRFEYVTQQLEHLVRKHLGLVDQDTLPTYLPRMVGTCPSDARPSVVVMCRAAEFKSIRATFQNRAAKALRVGKGPLVARVLSQFGRRAEREDHGIPHLPLVYYRTPTAITRDALDEPLLVDLKGGDVTCGGIIRYGTRAATLGLAIDIGDRTGILTVDHLFSSKATTHQPPPALENESFPSDESGSPVLEWTDSDSLWGDDDEYDDLDTAELTEAMDLDTDDLAEAMVLDTDELSKGVDLGLQSVEPFQRHLWDRLASSAQLTSAPYLDWALTCPTPFALPLGYFLTNSVFVPGSGRAVLQSFHSAPAAHLDPVYIVSGIRGIIHGEILFSPSFIPSSPGQESCEVWTAIPDASNGGIVSGECGSVVVDSATNKVYGHVVGSDPFGHAYVVPLAHVLAQVAGCFPGLPAPPQLADPARPQESSRPQSQVLRRPGSPMALNTLKPSDMMPGAQHTTSATHPLTETNLSLWQKTQESALVNRQRELRLNPLSEDHLETSSSVAVAPPSTTRSTASSVKGEDASERHQAANTWLPEIWTATDAGRTKETAAQHRLSRFHPLRGRRISHARAFSISTTHSNSFSTSASTDADGSGVPYQLYVHPGTNYARCISPSHDDDILHRFSGSEGSSPPQYAKTLNDDDLWGGSTATDQSVEERDVWGLESPPLSDMDAARRLVEENEYL